MPNGHNMQPEEFDKLEAPLRRLDVCLSEYASKHGMKLQKNYHNVPERSLTWTEDNEKVIQIYLENANKQTYHLWICAVKDINGERYWKQEYLMKDQPLAVIESNLSRELDTATNILRSWKDEHLKPSGAQVHKNA